MKRQPTRRSLENSNSNKLNWTNRVRYALFSLRNVFKVKFSEIIMRYSEIKKRDIVAIAVTLLSFIIALVVVVKTDITLGGLAYDVTTVFSLLMLLIMARGASKKQDKGKALSFFVALLTSQIIILTGCATAFGAGAGIVVRVATDAPVYRQNENLPDQPEDSQYVLYPDEPTPICDPVYYEDNPRDSICTYLFAVETQNYLEIYGLIWFDLLTWQPENADFDVSFSNGRCYGGRVPAHNEMFEYYRSKYYGIDDAKWENALDRIMYAARNTRAASASENLRLLAVRMIDRGDAQARQHHYSKSMASFAASYRYAIYALRFAVYNGKWQQALQIIRHNILICLDGNHSPVGAYGRLLYYHMHRPGGNTESAALIINIDTAFRIVHSTIESYFAK